MSKWLVILFCLLFFSVPSEAAIKLDFKGFIADEANLLSEDAKYNLNMTLLDLQKKSGADIAVVTLLTLDGRTVEDVALDIGRTYKPGAIGKNNGIVFLTALNERKMRLELGTGLENKISISQLENIRDVDILPYYRQNDYQNGIVRGTYQLAKLTAAVENVDVQIYGDYPVKKSSRKSRDPIWVYFVALIITMLSPGSYRYGSRRHRGFGGHGGFGGGGGFGGCGCSGSW